MAHQHNSNLLEVNFINTPTITFLGCKSLKVILNMVNDVHNKWTHEIRIIKIVISVSISIHFLKKLPACLQ